jgi:hypothetical protein
MARTLCSFSETSRKSVAILQQRPVDTLGCAQPASHEQKFHFAAAITKHRFWFPAQKIEGFFRGDSFSLRNSALAGYSVGRGMRERPQEPTGC